MGNLSKWMRTQCANGGINGHQFARVRGMVHDIPKNNQFYGPLETTFTGEIGIIMICKLINGLR